MDDSELKSRITNAAQQIQDVVADFDGEEFSRKLFDRLGITTKLVNEGDPVVRTVQTCWGCPSQWDAWTASGRYFYLRYRYGQGSVSAHTSETDSGTQTIAFFNYGHEMDGIITLAQFAGLAGLVVAPDAVHE